MLFDTLYIPFKVGSGVRLHRGVCGSLWVCSLIYLWTKTRAVESVEILHKR